MKNLSTEEQLDILKKSLDEIPRGILITDSQQDDDPIIYANKGFLQMSGYSLNEVLGKNCRFMQGEDTDVAAQEIIAKALQQQKSVSVKMHNYRKSGEKFWNEFTICPVRNDSGVVTHYVALERELDGTD